MTADPTTLETALAGLAEPPPPSLLRRVGTALAVGDQYAGVEGPAGPVWVAFSERGVSLLWMATDEDQFLAAYVERWGNRPLRRATAVPPELRGALAGRSPVPAYDLEGLSPFRQAVLRKTAEIPRGEVRPYAWVAREVGQPAAVRAVGTALGRNPIPILIPCHRVVRSDGRIGNYALGTPMKSRLLTEEGVDLSELVELASRGIRYLGGAGSRTYCLPTCRMVRDRPPGERTAFRSAGEAFRAGRTPCPHCRPAAEGG
jgi:O-6-methylguanine DNA methyltransferase